VSEHTLVAKAISDVSVKQAVAGGVQKGVDSCLEKPTVVAAVRVPVDETDASVLTKMELKRAIFDWFNVEGRTRQFPLVMNK